MSFENEQDAHGSYTLFLFHVVQIKTNFRATGSGFQDTGQFSKLPYLGMKLGKCPKFQKLHIYSLPIPRGRNWAFFALRTDFCSTDSGSRDTGQFSKFPYLGMMRLNWPKFQKLHIYNLNYSRVPYFTPFCSRVYRFPDNWGFWFLHKVQWWIWHFWKKIVKNRKLKISKIPNAALWGPLVGKFWSLKTSAAICRRRSVLKFSLPLGRMLTKTKKKK